MLPQSDNSTPWAESGARIRIKNINLSTEYDVSNHGVVGITITVVNSTFVHSFQLRKFHKFLLPSHFPTKRETIQNYNKEDFIPLFSAP